MKKQDLPSIHNYQLDIDLQKLRASCDTLAEKFVDVRTANPMLCDNHMELVASVYDNFEQINLTTPSEILPYTASIKERLKRREEHQPLLNLHLQSIHGRGYFYFRCL